MDYLDRFDSPLGEIMVASDGEAIIGLWLDGQQHFAASLGEAEPRCDLPVLQQARAWLAHYFEGSDPGMLPPTRPRGTAFRQMVWNQLATIPYGRLVTYGELGRRIEKETGRRTSARAIGGAVGHNPISIMLPCHRVIGSNGSLTGYAGGVDKKIALLKLEGVDVSALREP